jgi:hypothetical protein
MLSGMLSRLFLVPKNYFGISIGYILGKQYKIWWLVFEDN